MLGPHLLPFPFIYTDVTDALRVSQARVPHAIIPISPHGHLGGTPIPYFKGTVSYLIDFSLRVITHPLSDDVLACINTDN